MVDRRPRSRRTLNPVAAETDADAEAAGLFGPGSAALRINREAFLLLGAGPRALLLQLAHPLIAEGVSAHSDFMPQARRADRRVSVAK